MPWRDGAHDLREIIAWRIDDAVRQATTRRELSGGDPLLGDGAVDSPELERYRAARASLAELELAKRRGEVCDSGIIRAVLGGLAHHLRHGGEELARLHGDAARLTLEAAINDFERDALQFFETLDKQSPREPNDADHEQSDGAEKPSSRHGGSDEK